MYTVTKCLHFDALISCPLDGLVVSRELPKPEMVARGGQEVGRRFPGTKGLPQDFCHGVTVICFSYLDKVVRIIRAKVRGSVVQRTQSKDLELSESANWLTDAPRHRGNVRIGSKERTLFEESSRKEPMATAPPCVRFAWGHLTQSRAYTGQGA